LSEPEGRNREARFDEEDALFQATLTTIGRSWELAKVSGLRKRTLLLTWAG